MSCPQPPLKLRIQEKRANGEIGSEKRVGSVVWQEALGQTAGLGGAVCVWGDCSRGRFIFSCWDRGAE